MTPSPRTSPYGRGELRFFLNPLLPEGEGHGERVNSARGEGHAVSAVIW